MVELHFKIFRFDPRRTRGPISSITRSRRSPRSDDCLNRIKWEQDGTPAIECPAPTESAVRTDEDQRHLPPGLPGHRQDYQCPEVVLEPPRLAFSRTWWWISILSWKASKFRPYLIASAPGKGEDSDPGRGKRCRKRSAGPCLLHRFLPGELDREKYSPAALVCFPIHLRIGIMSPESSDRSTIPMEPGAASTTSNVPALPWGDPVTNHQPDETGDRKRLR
jgi:hypothetical protein